MLAVMVRKLSFYKCVLRYAYSNRSFERTVCNFNTSSLPLLPIPTLSSHFGIKGYRRLSKCSVGNTEENESDFINSDPFYKEMVKNIYYQEGSGHKLLVIQPRVKTGKNWEYKKTAEVKLSEAVALVETLEDWRVLDKHIVPVQSLAATQIFGKGNLEKIKWMIYKNTNVTAIFFGVNMLTAAQVVKFEDYFGIRVLDRYQIILQIFHAHAHTKEAKLQIALAEIPYLRVKLCGFSHTYNYNILSDVHHVGGMGQSMMETRRQLLSEREQKLKKALHNLKSHRHSLRQSEKRQSFPIVAVVGYTNSGKTTLIKALTNDEQLQPQNKLFATLDVTLHAGVLPSLQKVLYVDTVGFISDVPTTLIQSFRATLEDIACADLILHVRDVSHPSTENQKTVVLETLQKIGLPQKLLDSIIEVGNKIDLLEAGEEIDQGTLTISATKGIGLQHLAESIQNHIIKSKGHVIKTFRVPNGGTEYRWLCKEATVTCAVADENDPNYLLAEVIFSPSAMSKFNHYFGDLETVITR